MMPHCNHVSHTVRAIFLDLLKLLHVNNMLQETLATIRIYIADFTKVLEFDVSSLAHLF